MYGVLSNIFKRFLSQAPKPTYLGRWNLDYCTDTVHRKVTMNNEDHCGTCGNSTATHKIALAAAEEEEWLQYML